jgi:hypothetical protein
MKTTYKNKINWQWVEYKILRDFETLAYYKYATKTPYWPEYHHAFMAQQLLAEFRGWA